MTNAPTIEGWLRKLQDERLEIFLKADDRKIRASGPRAEMYELVDWFEEKTGLAVNVPERVYTGPRPIAGQMVITVGLQSDDEEDPSDG
jgi:hypothetical protein